MNWKLVSAFAIGAALASGIVYFAVRPVDIAKPSVAKAAVSPPVPTNVAVASVPAVPPVYDAPVPTRVAPTRAPVHRVAVREKRSPMPPPVRREKPVTIARNEPWPSSPIQTPQPTPPPKPAVTQPVLTAVPAGNVSLPAANSQVRVPHTVTLASGTLLQARIGETLSSARNQTGDTFLATLTRPLVIDGFIIADRGARVEGRVVDAAQAGRGNGVSRLGISIVQLATDDGQNIRIRTEQYTKNGASSTGTDTATVGAGAAIGAVIGAIAGGGTGAAIGAGVGGVAGAGGVLLTRGKPVEILVETRVSFKVLDSVAITERLD